MLRGIDPILSPDLLYALRAMGHGHAIAFVDANYPCDEGAAPIIRADGSSVTQVFDAVMTLMPLEARAEDAACCMIVDGDPSIELPVYGEFKSIAERHEDRPVALKKISTDDFKERTRRAYAVVVTGERRLYANIIVTKGVIPAAA